MNLALLDNKDINIDQISDHVKTYGSYTIGELLYIDTILVKKSGNGSGLLEIFETLIAKARAESDEINSKLLEKVRNHFELYRDICISATT